MKEIEKELQGNPSLFSLFMNDFDFMSDGYFDKAENILLKKEPSNA